MSLRNFYGMSLIEVLGKICAILIALTMCAGEVAKQDRKQTGMPPEPIETSEELKQFLAGPPAVTRVKNCDNVKEYISEILKVQIKELKEMKKKTGIAIHEGRGISLAFTEGVKTGEDQMMAELPTPTEFSQTNVLEAGIDEADVVKTDGSFIYLVDSGKLKIISAYPPKNITTTAETETLGTEILILKDEIYSFSGRGYYWWWSPLADYYYPYGKAEIEKFKFDGGNVNYEFNFEVDGMYDSARLFQDKIFIVGTSYLNLDLVSYIKYSQGHNVENIVLGKGVDIKSFLPKVRSIRKVENIAVIEEEPIAECENIYISSVAQGSGIVWIYVIDPSGEIKKYAILGVSGAISNPYVYMSQSALYVLFSEWSWWEEESKPKTTIYKFDINDELKFLSGVQVEGVIPSRWWSSENSLFSINEYNGMLRLALTTRTRWNSKNPDNMIFIFDQNLKKIGELRGIKPDEDIYAVRFFGNKAYIVTFRQIDPLFIADISDPHNPKLVGELEVPGFSTYLHPVGENKIFAVGRENGKPQVSLFDVSNPEFPKLITRIYLPSSWSEAESNYKALTFFKEFIALPIYKYEYKMNNSRCYNYLQTSGFLILKLSSDTLSMLGEAVPEELCSSEKYEDKYYNCSYYNRYCSYPLRTVFIENFIYGVMNSGIGVWTKEVEKVSLLRF